MLNSITLENFRSHKSTTLALSPKLNVLFGYTHAGKTSVLDSLAFGLNGRNHWTDARGRGAQRLIRDGADELKITIETSFGTVERVLGAKQHTLRVPDCPIDGIEARQAILLTKHLQTNAETLESLLDMASILDRPPKDQLKYILKALRPDKIEVSDVLKNAGIGKIDDIEHLLDLIKHRKETVLRDLNREAGDLEASLKVPVELPVWPLKNTKMTEDDVRQRVKERKAQLQAKRDERAGVQTLINKDHNIQAERAKVSDAEEADEKAYQQRKEMLAKYDKQITVAKERLPEREKTVADLRQQRENLIEVRADAQGLIKAAAELGAKCPTCDQPWPPAALQKAQKRQEKAKQQLAVAEQAVAEKTKDLQVADKELTEARETIGQLEELRRVALVQIHRYEVLVAGETDEVIALRVADNEKKLAVLDGEINELVTRVEAGEDAIRKIEAYYAAKTAAEKGKQVHEDRVRDLRSRQIPYEERVLEDLLKIRKTILDKKVATFTKYLNEAMTKMEQPEAQFDLEAGWMALGRPARFLSTGQAKICFEAAYRYALAQVTGVLLIVLDHLAPVDRAVQTALVRFFYKSGIQTIMTWTLEEKPGVGDVKPWPEWPPDIHRYWFTDEPEGSVPNSTVERIEVYPRKAAV